MPRMDSVRKKQHQELLQRVSQLIRDSETRAALYRGTESMRERSRECYAEMENPESLLRRARETKRRSLERWNENLDLFTKTARASGVKVYYAQDADDAVNYVLQVAREKRATTVTKTKSMTGEEIKLTQRLSEQGFEVIETDLGERVVQLANERPSHLTAPAIHMTIDRIARVFSDYYRKEAPRDPEALTNMVRESLREDFFRAQLGIIGANFAAADTGAIGIVTNEGNGRLVTAIPPTLIAVVGREKIVESLGDAFALLQPLTRSGAAQKITSYVSFISQKPPLGDDRSGAGEFHVVILDNGRSKMKDDSVFREALNCLRCGACMDACPTFRLVGGHVFGHIYVGPIGIPWTSFVHDAEKAGQISPLCISCGLCREVCPEDIDIPFLIGKVKEADVAAHGQLLVNQVLSSYETLVKLASATAPISNVLVRQKTFRIMLEKLLGLDRRRPFPVFTRQTLQRWARSRPRKPAPRKVAYFVDSFANYNNTEIGKGVIGVLEARGCAVEVPEQVGTGMPAFLYGNLKKTAKAAEFNVRSLARLVKDGYEIVTSEPTACFCLRELYPKLLETPDAGLVAKHSSDVFAFMLEAFPEFFMCAHVEMDDGVVAYHTPCHTRSIYSNSPALGALRRVGVNVAQVRYNTCCGMAGTYGFKKGMEGYEVSMEIGSTLFERIKAMGPDLVTTESSVCKMHIEHGCGLDVKHPIEIFDSLEVHA